MTTKLILFAAVMLTAVLASHPGVAQDRVGSRTEAERQLQRGRALEDAAVRMSPRDPEEAAETYEEAAGVYREALRLDSGLIEGYVRLGYVTYALGDPERAAAIVGPALRRWPNNTALRRVYGTVLYPLDGRRNEAVTHLEQVARAVDAFDVWHLLGAHYYARRRYRKAIAAFRHCLERKPDDMSVHGTLGRVYEAANDLDAAIGEFRVVLAQDPSNLSVQIRVADIRSRQGAYDEAIAIYEHAIKEAPTRPELHFNLASILFERGDDREALIHYRLYTLTHPDEAVAHYMMGRCYGRLGQRRQARDSLNRALTLKPSYGQAAWRLGLLDLDEGQLGDAQSHLEQASALEPDDPLMLVSLGDCQRRRGDLEAATETHQRASHLRPGDPDVLMALARDHFARGEFDEAVQLSDEARTRSPDRADIKLAGCAAVLGLGRARLAMGDVAGARSLAGRALSCSEMRAEAHLLEAASEVRGHRLDAARVAVDAAEVAEPGRPDVAFARAHIALLAEHFEVAIETLKTLADGAAAHDPAIAADLARAYAGQGRWKEAMKWFVASRRRGLDTEKANRAIALSALGWSDELAGTGKWHEALAALRAADKHRETLDEAARYRLDACLGIALGAVGFHAEAAARLRAATVAYPRVRREHRTEQRRTSRRDDFAKLESNRHLPPPPGQLHLVERRALALYNLDRPAETIALLEALPKGRGDVRHLLASAYVRAATQRYEDDDAKGAATLLAKAQKLLRKERWPLIAHNLAVLDYDEGRRSRAAKVFEALRADPELREAIFNTAIYLDDVRHDEEGAYAAYAAYLSAGGTARAEQALKFMEVKERVFGLSGGGMP